MSDNPFPGPQPYRAAQRTRFFREDAARKLANQVMACRVTTVHGPSGAGKSSLLQAAVLPALEESDRVRVVKIDGWPADVAPLARLMRAMTTEFGLESVPEDENPAEQFTKVVELSAQQANEQPILLYLDQFEQLFITNHADDDMKALLSSLASLLERRRDEDVHVILSLREDYLGRLGDWARARPELVLQKFRVGPLSVGEMVQAMCRTAKEGESSQEWNADEIRALMLEVRVPGQHATDAAEVQAAFGQIVCRALWEARAAGHMTEVRGANAEAMMHRYLDTTLAGLGAFQARARELLEQHLIDDEGRRRLLTEQEVQAVLGSGANDVVAKLEQAAILHAEARQGKRYFELGHDWLAKKVLERRAARKHAQDAAARQLKWIAAAGVLASIIMGSIGGIAWVQRNAAIVARNEANANADEAQRQRDDARRATMMAGARELIASGKPGVAVLVLAETDQPEKARGWEQLVIDTLSQGIPWRTLRFDDADIIRWSPDQQRIAIASNDYAVRIWQVNAGGDPIILKGHTGWIRSIAWSADGQRIVTASDDKTARIWYANGAGESLVFHGHEKDLTCATWSPDGTRIATGSQDLTARIWHADGKGTPIILKGHEEPGGSDGLSIGVGCPQWSNDGSRILTTAYNDSTLRVWNADGSGKSRVFNAQSPAKWSPTAPRIVASDSNVSARVWYADGSGTPLELKRDEGGLLWDVEWSPDGKHVVTTSWNESATVWHDIDSARADGSHMVTTFRGHKDLVRTARWSPDGQRIVTASSDKTAQVWDADGTGEPLLLRGHEDFLYFADWSADGQRIVTAANDKTARIWKSRGSDGFITLNGRGFNFDLDVDWSPDGKRIVIGSGPNADIWNADGSGKPVMLGAPRRVSFVRWSPDNSRVVLVPKGPIWCSNDRCSKTPKINMAAQVWNADGSGTAIQLAAHTDEVTYAAWSPDSTRIVTASKDKTARIWNADGTGETLTLTGHDQAVLFVVWSPDGRRIVTTSGDTTARVWSLVRNAEPLILKGHSERVNYAAWSPDGKSIATASDDGTVRVWDADSSGQPVILEGLRHGVSSVEWSPNGTRIIGESGASEAWVWNADGSGTPLILRGHTSSLSAAHWSPNGTQILTASYDGTARIWNTDGSGESIVLNGHKRHIKHAAWSSDGHRVMTASDDGVVRFWLVGIPLLQQALRNATTDCLTPEQRQTYLLESESDARTRYESCERSYGRTPSANP